MTIMTTNGFLTNGVTFSDVIQNTDENASWYKIWDEDANAYFTEGAEEIDGNWVSADSLSQMQLPYAQNNFYVAAFSVTSGQSPWADFTVSIGNMDSTIALSNQSIAPNTSVSYNQVIDTDNFSPNGYLRIYNPNESNSTGDTGWIKPDELSDYSFTTGENGQSTQLWVDTWISSDGRSGWEDIQITASENQQESIFSYFFVTLDHKGYSESIMESESTYIAAHAGIDSSEPHDVSISSDITGTIKLDEYPSNNKTNYFKYLTSVESEPPEAYETTYDFIVDGSIEKTFKVEDFKILDFGIPTIEDNTINWEEVEGAYVYSIRAYTIDEEGGRGDEIFFSDVFEDTSYNLSNIIEIIEEENYILSIESRHYTENVWGWGLTSRSSYHVEIENGSIVEDSSELEVMGLAQYNFENGSDVFLS